jgi:glutathione S-transferase
MSVPCLFQGPVIFGGQDAQPEKLEKINEALGYLNQFLVGQDWVAGDSMTIADIALVVTVSNSEVRFSISPLICVVSDFRRGVGEICVLPGYYTM